VLWQVVAIIICVARLRLRHNFGLEYTIATVVRAPQRVMAFPGRETVFVLVYRVAPALSAFVDQNDEEYVGALTNETIYCPLEFDSGVPF
jgi:hypothetical protein